MLPLCGRRSLLRVAGKLAMLAATFAFSQSALAEDPPKSDLRYPFRTDFANTTLPWYQPKPLEFPPHHSDHRVSGELVSLDFIHRTGQFRATKNGELMDFTMPPYGAINYLNAEADLRDVPLGTFFLFFLNQDARGQFTRLATMQDQFTMDAGHGFSYRLDEAKLSEGKLLTTKQSPAKNQPDLGKKELLVTEETRVWKGAERIKLADLKPGDELLYNLTAKTATSPGHCSDVWVGADTHKLATEEARKKFLAFTKFRGVPGWVEKTEGNKMTVTLFSGDPQNFKSMWMADFVAGKDARLVVANDELRTWNPPTDKETVQLLEIQGVPMDSYGCSGVRLVMTVNNMLEGFRQGRVVRLFGPAWTMKDQFYGESLMGYGYERLRCTEIAENVALEFPKSFPFRTDYGNEQLPWYQLKPGQTPPQFAEHRVLGELVKADAATRTGRFRTDRTGEVVDFTLIPDGTVKHLNADATLADLTPGTRCRFHLFQDEKGAFTKATLVTDEFSYLAANVITWRVEEAHLAEGRLRVARQIPEMKNYNGDMERIPDLGRSELLVNDQTHVWKSNQPAKLTDIAVGDSLLVNVTAELPGQPSRCTDIWIGADTHKLVTEQETKKFADAKKPTKKP